MTITLSKTSLRTTQMPELSIVVPVYNEAATISNLVGSIGESGLDDYELIIVDDYSTDGTRDVIRSLEKENDSSMLKARFHTRNRGKGAALRTGLEVVSGKYVVFQDADLEYDPKDLITMREALRDGLADIVYGSRLLHPDIKQQSPFWHRMINRGLTEFSNFFTGLRLTDMETCYKMFPGSCLKHLRIEEDRFGVEPELTAKLAAMDLRFIEVPISYERRSYEAGKKIGFVDGLRALYVISKYGLASL